MDTPLTATFDARVRAEMPELAARIDALSFEPIVFHPSPRLCPSVVCSRCAAVIDGREESLERHRQWHTDLTWGFHSTAMMVGDTAAVIAELAPVLTAAVEELEETEDAAEGSS